MNNLLIKSIKILLILFIFYYLYENDHINFDIFKQLMINLKMNIFLIFLTIITILTGAFKWSLILRSTNIQNSFIESFKIYYMCSFFNNFLFGNMGGDFLKVYYVSTLTTINKTKNSLSILIDRIFGFIGLITVATVSLIIILLNKNQYQYILYIFFIILIILLLSFYFLKLIKKINFFYNLIDYLKLKKMLIFWCILVSVITYLICHIIVYFISSTIFSFDISLNNIFFANSISALLSAVPLTPGGVGLGEISFVYINNNVFNLYLNNLANIIVYMRILSFISSLPGIFLFINYKRSKKINTKFTS